MFTTETQRAPRRRSDGLTVGPLHRVTSHGSRTASDEGPATSDALLLPSGPAALRDTGSEFFHLRQSATPPRCPCFRKSAANPSWHSGPQLSVLCPPDPYCHRLGGLKPSPLGEGAFTSKDVTYSQASKMRAPWRRMDWAKPPRGGLSSRLLMSSGRREETLFPGFSMPLAI